MMNLCNLPPWAIASRHYNRHPQPLEIQGVRHANRLLFERLDGLSSPEARGAQFHDYMDVTFQLHQWEREATAKGRKSLKNSYLRFLRGWMFESNSLEGAVLKGWVESRLGLPPTFHRVPDRRYPFRGLFPLHHRPHAGLRPHQRHQRPARPALRIRPV
jgi:NAD+---dinitrogen-reductase ADP-D-ribosyltransferase